MERELERRETEITQHEEEVETLRKGRQTLLREMNLLQTESGAKIKELEDAKNVAEDRVAALERDGENAAAETERITGNGERRVRQLTMRMWNWKSSVDSAMYTKPNMTCWNILKRNYAMQNKRSLTLKTKR